MADSSALKQIADKIKDSSNVLVTVNSNPSVDELSAALGITLLINKLNKHATAVFSGAVPPAIEFLNPEKTFENTVDSLRDFIIALDKEKADHLRYKVVDDMVKIFITPYRTTINEQDLDFSQGDYNVEVVLAIGVTNEADLDHALESHGRILHDATVAAISVGESTKLGGIEWNDASASSYGELLFTLGDAIRSDKKLIDEQIATAFLTGIVAATDRFSNDKTTSKVMTIAAELMSAGANQQLIATKLEEESAISTPEPQPSNDGGDLKEGESQSLNNAKNSDDAPKEENKPDDKGALQISHEASGDVDAVKTAVETKDSNDALQRATEQLKATEASVADTQTDDAEKELARELTAPATGGIPSVADLHKDIANASKEVDAAAAQPATIPVAPPQTDLLGAVAPDQFKTHADQEASEPNFGGTLNATTEQAEEDKRKQIADDRNHVILNHGGAYTNDVPSFQAPLNSTSSAITAEPVVASIYDATSDAAPTARVDAIQPPEPIAPAAPSAPPTLAEIDAKNRSAHTDARAAVDAALSAEPLAPSTPAPAASSELPPLPPLPPMPDFSTLPPLPGASAPMSDMSTPSTPATSVPDTLGDLLPPSDAPASPPVAAEPGDPSQFRIPGQ